MARSLANSALKLTRYERLLGVFSPKAAFDRAQWRMRANVLPQMMARYYEAARPQRSTYGWLAGFTSANAETFGGLVTLRARSRELVRNNSYMRKAIGTLTGDCTGAGVMVRPRTGDVAIDKRITALWADWAGTNVCDAEGHYNIYGLQKLAVRSFFEGGETLIRRIPRPRSAGLKVPLQLMVLEGDYLDYTKNGLLTAGKIVQGVELDADGIRRNLWMFPEHPGEMAVAHRPTYQSMPVPASSVIHLYEKERPGQQRGVAWAYAAMMALRHIGDYKEAELLRKRLEACFAAIVVNPEGVSDPATGDVGVTPQITDLAGNRAESIEPAMFYYAKGGSDIKFPQPSNTGVGYAAYLDTELHSVAAGLLMTYELLTGDLSKVNYSSLRAGMVAYRRLMTQLQWTTIIPVAFDPLYRDFIDTAAAAGLLPLDTPYTCEWSPPAWEAIDPLKDAAADQINVRSLFKTQAEVMSERGGDWQTMVAEQAAFNDVADKAGLVLDSDPRKTAAGGKAQLVGEHGISTGGGGSQALDPKGQKRFLLDGQEFAANETRVAELIYSSLKRGGLNGEAALLTRQLVNDLLHED